MTRNQYGELIFSDADICNLLMSGKPINDLKNLTVDATVDINSLMAIVENNTEIQSWRQEQPTAATVEEYDQLQQQKWHMSEEYRKLDIAKYILDLCTTPEQLQRVGEELLLYADRDLFDLLRYLKYLVDTMTANRIIWGVGRGSSVASYVLYLLGVHRIDSMFYDLDPKEFLR